jgi:type I restriction enzyme S subunit
VINKKKDQARKLSEVVEIINGGTPKTTCSEYWNGKISWITPSDMSKERRYVYTTGRCISEKGLQNSSTNVLLKGDCIISARGTVGVVNQLQEPMAFNQTCYGIRADESIIDKNYLYYMMCYYSSALLRVSHGAVFNTINRAMFDEIIVKIPHKENQERIANILWLWDQAIEKLDKLIEAKLKFRKALMQKLLTGQLRFPGFGKPVSKKGDVPEGWILTKLKDVSDIIMGCSPSSGTYNTIRNGLPLIQGNEDITDEVTTPKRWTSQITRECQIGDIIMTVRAPVGEIALSKHHACIGRGVCAIRPTTTDRQFLYYLLQQVSKTWHSLGQGSTFTCLTKDDIANLNITIPQIVEQQKVGGTIGAMDREIKTMSAVKAYYNQQRQGLMELFFK